MSTSSRKILVPLATLVAAGAVAVGSGATYTAQTENTISAVTSGTFDHTNSKDGQAIFNLQNMKPGDTVIGAITLTNTGSLPGNFSLTESASSNAFSSNLLSLAIEDTTTGASVFNGTFGGLADGSANALGEFAAGESRTYRFTVQLSQAATVAEQGKTASAAYTWDSVQLDAETFDQQ